MARMQAYAIISLTTRAPVTTASVMRFRTPMVCEGQVVVVQPELMQQRGVQIINAHPAFDCTVPDVVGDAVDVSGPDSPAGQQQAERVAVVIATRAVL